MASIDVQRINDGHLLEFHDRHGHPQRWAMPHELLEEQREYRKVLRRLGLSINSAARTEIQLYLEVWHAEARARCVDRVGWYEGAYVLPNEVTAEIDWNRIDVTRTHWPFLRDRRVDAYSGIEQRLID